MPEIKCCCHYIKIRLYAVVLLSILGLMFCVTFVTAAETSDYVHYRLGVKYKNEKKIDQAIEEFRKVLAAYPDNYNTYMHLAEIREYQERHRLAIYNLKKALAYNPGWGKAQKRLAAVYEKDGQFQNAIKEMQDYYQVCDPAERDSIQKQIDRLITVVRYGGRKRRSEPKTSSAKEPQSPVDDIEASLAAPKKTGAATARTTGRKRTSPAVKNAVAENEFKLGIAAYSEGVSSQSQALFDKAIGHLRKTLKLQPRHSGAYYYAGLIRRRNGQNKMAKINFEKAVSYPELGYNAHFYLGKIYGEEKKYKVAITHLKKYNTKTDYEPGKREAQTLIDRYTAAYNAAHEDTLKVDIAALGRDELHREISKIPQEAVHKSMEVRIDSLLFMSIVDTLTDPGQAMLKGVKSFLADRFDDAIDDFKKVLLKYPSGDVAARCVYNIGVCYMKLKNFGAAEGKFQQVLDQYRTHSLASQSLFLMGMSYLERRESPRAEKIFRKFIQKYRSHTWTGKAYEKLGDAYVDMMQDKKAVDAYSHAAEIAKSPLDAVYALFKLGEAYFKIGNTTRAVDAFQKAIIRGEKKSVFVRIPDSYYKIADHYYQQKKYTKALDFYRKVTRKYPSYQDTPWGLFQIGSIYKNIKKYDKAIKIFKKLINSHGDDYWARQARWKLEDTVWEHEYRAVLK